MADQWEFLRISDTAPIPAGWEPFAVQHAEICLRRNTGAAAPPVTAPLVLGRRGRVPASGVAWLEIPDNNPTNQVPVTLPCDCAARALSIRVNTADNTRDYTAVIEINGAPVPGLVVPLPAGQIKAVVTLPAAVQLAAGDDLRGRIQRTSGSGQSTFNRVAVAVSL